MSLLQQEHDGSFVIRPRPLAMESLGGFRIRVAEANRFPYTTYLRDQSEVAPQRSHLDPVSACNFHSLRGLASRLRLPHSILEAQWPPLPFIAQHEADVEIGKLDLVRADVRVDAVQICPACVREDGFASQLWEIRYYTACHRHRCLMTTHCQACGKLLSDTRGALLRCRSCGVAIAEPAPTRIASEPVLMLSKAIAAAAKTGNFNRSKLHAYGPLFAADLKEGFRAMRTMAWMVHGPKRPWLTKVTEAACSRHAALEALMMLFERWPAAWFDHLNARVASAEFKADAGLRHLFRREIDRLDPETSTVPTYMRAAFIEWLLGRYPTVGKTRSFQSLAHAAGSGNELMSLNEAADVLGVSYRKAHDWAKEGKLGSQYAEMGSYRRVYVYRDSVDKLAEERITKLTMKEVAAKLGVSPRVVTSLVDHGLLPELVSDSRKARFVSVQSVASLIEKVGRAKLRRPVRSDMGIPAILAMAGSRWPGMAGLVDAIVNRQLPVSHFDAQDGLMSIRVPRDALKSMLREASMDESLRWVSVKEASQYLGVSKNECLSLLRSMALGPTPSHRTRERDIRIDYYRCQGFKERYASVDELAENFKVSRAGVTGILSVRRLGQARAPNGKAIRGWYERCHAERLLRGRAAAKQQMKDGSSLLEVHVSEPFPAT